MLNCDASIAVHLLILEPARVCNGLWAPNVVFLANDNVVIHLLFFFFLPIKLRQSMSSKLFRELIYMGTY